MTNWNVRAYVMQEKGYSVWLSLNQRSIAASMHLGYSETNLRVGRLETRLIVSTYIFIMYPIDGTVRQSSIVPHY